MKFPQVVQDKKNLKLEKNNEFREMWEENLIDLKIKDINQLAIYRHENGVTTDRLSGIDGEWVEFIKIDSTLVNSPNDLWELSESGFNCKRTTPEERKEFPRIEYIPYVYYSVGDVSRKVQLDSKFLFWFDEEGNELGR